MLNTNKKFGVINSVLYISLGVLILTILSLQSLAKATPVHAASCSGGFSASQINSYLGCYGSPMNGMGSSFMTYGQKYNVDPRFMVAIAGAETSFGRNLCTSYNPFNWFFNKWCNSPYSSWDSAINSVTAGVGNNYLQKGQTTISSFVYSCGTHCYCQNCTNWYNNVRAFYSQQGGNPDTSNLTYQGNQGGSSGTVVTGPSGYTFCANENEHCSFSGTQDVAYGANGKFTYKTRVTNGIDCNNSVFGDPNYGTAKACYIKPSSILSGGLDLNDYCKSIGYVGVVLVQNTAYGWNCKSSNGHTYSMNLYNACQWQYHGALPTPRYSNFNDPNSWKCYSQ